MNKTVKETIYAKVIDIGFIQQILKMNIFP